MKATKLIIVIVSLMLSACGDHNYDPFLWAKFANSDLANDDIRKLVSEKSTERDYYYAEEIYMDCSGDLPFKRVAYSGTVIIKHTFYRYEKQYNYYLDDYEYVEVVKTDMNYASVLVLCKGKRLEKHEIHLGEFRKMKAP